MDKSSAAPPIDGIRAGIEATHSDMCKFATVNASGYKAVVSHIKKCAQNGPATIVTRWAEEREQRMRARQSKANELTGQCVPRIIHLDPRRRDADVEIDAQWDYRLRVCCSALPASPLACNLSHTLQVGRRKHCPPQRPRAALKTCTRLRKSEMPKRRDPASFSRSAYRRHLLSTLNTRCFKTLWPSGKSEG